MSFNGPAFLSYRTEIARHITHKSHAAVIYNDTHYSVTTSKHQGLLRRALPTSVPVFHYSIGRGLSLGDVTGSQLFDYAVDNAKDCSLKAEKAKSKKDWWENEQRRWLQRAEFVSTFFGLRRKVDAKTIERLAASQKRAEAKAAKERIAREEEQRNKERASYVAWINGEDEGYFHANLFPVSFRIEGDELVSTMGARVPLAEAKRALRFALAHKDGWQRNGETCPVGMYQLDSINPQGIIAGCHRITWAEVERLAPMLA